MKWAYGQEKEMTSEVRDKHQFLQALQCGLTAAVHSRCSCVVNKGESDPHMQCVHVNLYVYMCVTCCGGPMCTLGGSVKCNVVGVG